MGVMLMDEIVRVDNTLLVNVAICDARAIAGNILHRRSKEDKIAADMGNVFHAALEEHFRGGSVDNVMFVFEAAYDALIPPGEQPAEPRFAKENVLRIMRRYIQVRPLERYPFIPVKFEETVGFEIAPGIVFYVKRDLLVQDKNSGMMYPVDHKTTGRVTDYWAKRFRMTSQMTGYCWATSQETGKPCLECQVNAIELGKLPSGTAKCKSHKVPYNECGVEHAKFELLTYSRTPEMIARWKQDAIILANRFRTLKTAFADVKLLPYAQRQGAFNGGCDNFCEHKKWCSMGFAESAMDSLTVYEPWAPWDTTSG
jgi:hypothetical protein